MDKYGVAFAIYSYEDSAYNSNFPQVCTCVSEDEAILIAKEYKKYRHCNDVTPFRNLSGQRRVNWSYIKENKI